MNSTLIAVTLRPLSVLYLFDNEFSLVGRLNFTDSIRSLDVACSSDNIFLVIGYLEVSALRARIDKYDLSDLSQPIQRFNFTTPLWSPRGRVVGTKLISTGMTTAFSRINAFALDIDTLTPLGNLTYTTISNVDSYDLYPVFTESGEIVFL